MINNINEQDIQYSTKILEEKTYTQERFDKTKN